LLEWIVTGLQVSVRKIGKAAMAARSAQSVALALGILVVASHETQNAIANGDTRTISLHNLHTQEDLTVTYKRNGNYDPAGLKRINHILRDWRRDEEIEIDPRLIDLVWEVQRDLGNKEAINIICGYRAPETNAMLRRRSGGVARHSQHTLGKAMDFAIPGVDLEKLREVGLRLQRGGVGFYPTSGSPFVHLDVGPVRHWPRVTREQLVRLFPDGRTVHIPSDGQPLSGYALAMADIERRGGTVSQTSFDAARNGGIEVPSASAAATTDAPASSGKKFSLARLFGFKTRDSDEDEDRTTASAPAAKPKPVQVALARAAVAAPAAAEPVPLPRTRPAVVAAAQPAPARSEAKTDAPAASTPNAVIAMRGFWRGIPDMSPRTTDEMSAARQQPVELASAEPSTTGNAGPWQVAGKDRVPGEIALAYAAQEPVVQRAAPMGETMLRMPASAIAARGTTTTAAKANDAFATARLAPGQVLVGARYSDPWLRAMITTPNATTFLGTSLFGAPDFRALQPMLHKPDAVLLMTFAENPHLGLRTETFSGPAIVFLATATFVKRTSAALQ
jgi:uncharacterized protein YcbK (DUF882 family)